MMCPDAAGSPIFILGNARSGTTLLRLMLTCHKNIVIVPECGFSVWLYERYRNWSWDQERLQQNFLPELLACRKIDTWQMDSERLRAFIERRKPDTYTDLSGSVYEYYASTRGRPYTRWGDKTTFHVHYVGRILTVFPDARLIHIIRDGRDVACSYRELNRKNLTTRYAPNLPQDMVAIAEQWKSTVATVDHDLAQLGNGAAHELRYEDLVSDPVAVLGRVCDFLDESYDPNMLDYHRENRLRELEPRELLPWKEKTMRPPDPAGIGRFRRDLTPGEIRSFEDASAEVLVAHGYALGADTTL